MQDVQKAKTIISIEKLRLIESELFRLTAKYGVKTINNLDALVVKGQISEEVLGDDVFLFDYLLSERDEIGKKTVLPQ